VRWREVASVLLLEVERGVIAPTLRVPVAASRVHPATFLQSVPLGYPHIFVTFRFTATHSQSVTRTSGFQSDVGLRHEVGSIGGFDEGKWSQE
jgi:hypothetical protein